MKKKKIFVAILFAVLACFVFTGCSSQENSKTEGKSQGETAANTPREQDRPDLLGKVKSVAEDSLIVFKSEDMQPPEQGEGGPSPGQEGTAPKQGEEGSQQQGGPGEPPGTGSGQEKEPQMRPGEREFTFTEEEVNIKTSGDTTITRMAEGKEAEETTLSEIKAGDILRIWTEAGTDSSDTVTATKIEIMPSSE